MTDETDIWPEVVQGISWTDLFHKDMTPEVRKKRWIKCLDLSPNKRMSEYWTDTSACHGCKHLEGAWCRMQELPCTVNPVLTIKGGGGIGMACMGAGFEK